MRTDTDEIYRQKVNQVIDYISANLHQPLTIDRLADLISVSHRQLIRIMRYSLNERLFSYIARQRLEQAVLYMQTEKTSLTKLAERVGYENPQSFSKAFKKQFGTPPKAFLNELQKKLENFNKSCSNQQRHPIPEIIEEVDLELVYIRIVGKYGEEESYDVAWNKLIVFLENNQALSPENRLIGISFSNPYVTKSEQCRFYACASIQKRILPKGDFGIIRLPKGKYAVYTLKGSYLGLQELYNNISLNFPYKLRYGMAFEEYCNNPRNTKKEVDFLTKIFIPIK